MKKHQLLTEFEALLGDFLSQRLPVNLFLALCLNLLIAPTVLAATGSTISRLNAYAIAFLVLVTVGLAIYLLVAMLQPQRF